MGVYLSVYELSLFSNFYFFINYLVCWFINLLFFVFQLLFQKSTDHYKDRVLDTNCNYLIC